MSIEIRSVFPVIKFDINGSVNEARLLGVHVFYGVNNAIVVLDDVSMDDLKSLIGKMEYRFRKGVGYKGEYYRLKFKEESSGRYVFYRHKKVKNRLKLDNDSVLVLGREDLRYVYPLVLASDLKDDGMHWSENYIIFPYEYGEKQPVSQDRLKKMAPSLYSYLLSVKEPLMRQSRYDKRIQNVKEFYGVIRVGKYTYSDIFVAIRDNTKLSPCVISRIKTHWGEYKNPIFDGHVSYVAVGSIEEAEYLVSKLKNKKVEKIISKLFDARSIGTRLPINIPKYKP
ncbi:MAG: hypothetical protein JHC31_04475 [Sulfurihydrogenibium sp.]|jgi:hypothetical protein|nr:hypothetical protein [Sulfurihydrogenibium sp.]